MQATEEGIAPLWGYCIKFTFSDMDFFKIILVFCFSIHCNQPTKEPITLTQPNKVKYVFAAAGLRLREAPDLKSKNIIALPYGSEVEILRKTGIALSLDAYTSGEWAEVKWKDKTGYAFDGYFLDKREFARFDKVFQFVKRKLSEKQKEYGFSYKYQIDKNWDTSRIQFNQKKSNSRFTVYTFMPEKYSDRDHCNFYMSSTCINIILDDKDNIVFTDLDIDQIGTMDYMDEEIVRFGYDGGEGDNCSQGGVDISFIYVFKSKTFIKREISVGSVCDDESCDHSGSNSHCKKWKDFRKETYSVSEPTAKIKEYFKRTKESEKK